MPWEETDGMDDMTPEKIIAEACGLIPPFDFPVEQIMEAFARHGKIIVPEKATPQMLKAGIAAFENADYDGDMMLEFADVWAAMTKDTGS